MGAHPVCPSLLAQPSKPISLLDWINAAPLEVLGSSVVERYGSILPFLFKVLAASKPLSIQVHPNRYHAARGFKEEEAKCVPYDAPERNYKDACHKPELLCALEPMWALQGFRTPVEIMERLKELKLSELRSQLIEHLEQARSEEEGLRNMFEMLMTLPTQTQREYVSRAIEVVEGRACDSYTYEWLVKLHKFYAGDIGILSPIFLNLLQLRPGEAIYQRSGVIHTYLEGVGLELTANSDNVLRAGLTNKHIALPELLEAAHFQPHKPICIAPQSISPQETVYFTPASEFVLYRISVHDTRTYFSPTNRSIEILFCTEGSGLITHAQSQTRYYLRPGASFVVPASIRQYTLEGNATVFRATVPLSMHQSNESK
jgi:mannose-6-phosphate isomerase